MLRGLSPAFAGLSPSGRQITHTLLTRSPLYSEDCSSFRVRLACVKHAASVHSEPASDSPIKFGDYSLTSSRSDLFRVKRNFLEFPHSSLHCPFFKELRCLPTPKSHKLKSIGTISQYIQTQMGCQSLVGLNFERAFPAYL